MSDALPENKKHDIWMTRMYFLFMMGGWGSVVPFINLFMARQGLNGTQIGWIVAAGSILSLFTASIWTHFHSHGRYPIHSLALSLIASGLFTLILGFQTTFIMIAVFYCLRMSFVSAHVTTADLLALHVLSGTSTGYGTIRYWGSLGWSVTVLFTGWMNQNSSIRSGFILYACLNLIAVLTLFRIREKPVGLIGHSLKPLQFIQGIQEIRFLPPLLAIAMLQLFSTIGNLGIQNFETLYLDRLGAAEFLIGVACMVSAAVEILGLPWADRLIHKFGDVQMLIVCMGLNILLRGVVFLFPSVWSIILTRAFGGISFSILTVGLINYVKARTSADKQGTTLVALVVLIPTTVSILFSPVFGFLFDIFGTRNLYPISQAGYLIAGLLFFLKTRGDETAQPKV